MGGVSLGLTWINLVYQDRIKKFTPAMEFQSPYSHVFAPEKFSLRLKNKYNSQFKL